MVDCGARRWKRLRRRQSEKYLAVAPTYVEEQYAGKKEALRPIYEKVLQLAAELGVDVKACPCKTIVPLYRNHVFAHIKPTTNTRLDLGLALTQYKGRLPKRLVDTGGLPKKDRITHRIELKSASEIDQEVEKWLKIAYGNDLQRKTTLPPWNTSEPRIRLAMNGRLNG